MHNCVKIEQLLVKKDHNMVTTLENEAMLHFVKSVIKKLSLNYFSFNFPPFILCPFIHNHNPVFCKDT